MANIKDLGKVYTSDILIIGGGIGGLCTGIRAKENNPKLNVLVVDRAVVGWAGQALKAGNGVLAREPHQDPQKMADYLVKVGGDYMNDQEFLLDYVTTIPDSIEFLDHCGVKLSRNADGSLRYFTMPNGLWSGCGIELDNVVSLRAHALKVGVRLLSHVQIFDLLTDDKGAVIGGVGFDSDDGNFHIFNAKAVVVATDGCYFKKVGGMFMGYGNGLAAAYRVGAMMRNAELAFAGEPVYTATNQPCYGAFNIIHNKDGVNISDIYAPNAEESTPELQIGMWKEVQEGRGPLYADLRNPDSVREFIGGQGTEFLQRLFPDKLRWVMFEEQKAHEQGRVINSETPEITIIMRMLGEFLWADRDFKTSVEGLWTAGKMSYQGSSYWGWVRGDGLGNAAQTALRVGDSIVKYVDGMDMPELNYDQIVDLKEKLYAPLNRKSGRSPYEIFDRMEEMAHHVDIVLQKTEKSILGVLDMIEEMKKIVPELIADDAHGLAKCREAADCLLCLEIMFRSALMRKETRGTYWKHVRADYPEHDDKNWLKWINVKQGEDGEMDIWTEDIPLWRYRIRPEGYEIPEGHVEEYYV